MRVARGVCCITGSNIPTKDETLKIEDLPFAVLYYGRSKVDFTVSSEYCNELSYLYSTDASAYIRQSAVKDAFNNRFSRIENAAVALVFVVWRCRQTQRVAPR
jgi:hypothetical protein